MPGLGAAAMMAKQQAAAFSPSDIANLVGWWKADAGAGSADGDQVSNWLDQSGNGKNAVGLGGAGVADGRNPLYKTNIIGSMPVVRFDGSNDELRSSAPATTVTDNFTQFTVAQTSSAASGACVPIFNGNGSSNGWGNAWNANGTNIGWLRGGVAWHASGTAATTSLQCLVGRRASGTFNLYKNGGTSVLSTSSAPTAPATRVNFGSHDGVSLRAVDLCEGIIYAGALSDSQINQVGAYLAARWGFTWTNL